MYFSLGIPTLPQPLFSQKKSCLTQGNELPQPQNQTDGELNKKMQQQHLGLTMVAKKLFSKNHKKTKKREST